MFVWTEKELNEEQSKAVIEDKNVFLIACPGSGKTRTLTYKIAFELSRIDSNKKHIIAITYTNRAADEIKERIELLGVETKQLWIGTIHSFCLEWILRPYSPYLHRLKHGFNVINAFETETIITDICNHFNNENTLRGRERVTYWDCGFIATPTPGFRVTSPNKSKHQAVKSIIKKYFKVLRETNRIDFEQILYFSLELLKKEKLICPIISQIFPYILVDEYQDTKEIQYHIICSILSAGNGQTKLFIVGDPNQSIYQTLGGYAIEFDDLENLSSLSIRTLELNRNYRSSDKIIDYFEHFRTFENENIATGDFADYNSIITLNNNVTLANLIDEIARVIEYNVNDLGIPQSEICVIAPQWFHLASATRKLILRLPNYSFDGPGMAPFSRDIDNFWYKLSKIILTEPSPGMYLRRIRWSSDILQELNNVGVDVASQNSKQLLKFCNSIHINEDNGLKYLECFFDIFCDHFGIDLGQFNMLNEHYNSFFESSSKRIERLLNEGIEYIGTIDTFKKVFKQKNGITVSTYHGVKGAEYDTVIAFALLQDYIPHFSDTNGISNSKKLLYVLSSRARKNLFLISERGRYKPFGNPPQEYLITNHLRTYNYNYDDF